MLDRRCWTFNRSNVTRAFALGLFIAFIPPTPLPVHLVDVRATWRVFRLNLPVLVATVFISNPFTWVPQVAGSLWVGAKLLGMDLMPFLHAISHRTLWADMGNNSGRRCCWARWCSGSSRPHPATCWRKPSGAHTSSTSSRRRRARSSGRGIALD